MEFQLTEKNLRNFFNKVNKNGPIMRAELTKCHVWTGFSDDGYGKFRLHNFTYRAHRIAFFIANGYLPDDLDIAHTCDNRLCVNPDHLEAKTRKENHNDRDSRNRVASGTKSGLSKFTKVEIFEIYQLYFYKGITILELAKRYDSKSDVIKNIVNHKSYKNEWSEYFQ